MADYLPYARHTITEDDLLEVLRALRSGTLTKGAEVKSFELAMRSFVGAKYAVAVSSGTAALHLAVLAAKQVHKEWSPNSRHNLVNVPTLTFAATANCVKYAGMTPHICNVDEYLRINMPEARSDAVATITVDFAGNPVSYDSVRAFCRQNRQVHISDACHSLGGEYKGRRVGHGELADITCFSFHPSKSITTGEGGMLVTNNEMYASAARIARDHGIETDLATRDAKAQPEYDIQHIGYNYRMTDMQAALGRSQLTRIDDGIRKRKIVTDMYNAAIQLKFNGSVIPLHHTLGSSNHIYVVHVPWWTRQKRDEVFKEMRLAGIGVAWHYPPLHKLTAYTEKEGDKRLEFSANLADRILTLPLFAGMTAHDVARVVEMIH